MQNSSGVGIGVEMVTERTIAIALSQVLPEILEFSFQRAPVQNQRVLSSTTPFHSTPHHHNNLTSAAVPFEIHWNFRSCAMWKQG